MIMSTWKRSLRLAASSTGPCSKRQWEFWKAVADNDLPTAMSLPGPDVIDYSPPSGTTSLQMAAQKGNAAMVKFLLSKGADPDATDYAGFNAFHHALYAGSIAVARSLFASGGKTLWLEIRDDDGGGLLHKACSHLWNELSWRERRQQMAVVKFLVSAGAQVNAKDDDGATPLHQAALKGKTRMVRFLIAKGAELDARSNAGDVALHEAAWGLGDEHLSTVKVLVSKGADINARNGQGQTALQIAKRSGHRRVVDFLLSKGSVDEAEEVQEVAPEQEAPDQGTPEMPDGVGQDGPQPAARGGPFCLRIESIFNPGEGMMVAGPLTGAPPKVGETVEITGPGRVLAAVVRDVTTTDQALAEAGQTGARVAGSEAGSARGMRVALLLADVKESEIQRGDEVRPPQ